MNVCILLFLGGCSNTRVLVEGTKRIIIEDDTQNNRSEKVSIENNEFTQGHFKIGNPYIINNIKYIPKLVSNYDEEGIASWYGPKFHKKLTANGEVFDQNKVSAAHKTLPLPSIVKVTNLKNNKKIYIRINDRGPFVNDRIIDLSKEAAIKLNVYRKGTENVRVQFIETGPHLLSKKFLEQEYLNKYARKLETSKENKEGEKKYYYLQLGAFSEENNAKSFLEKIKKRLDKEIESYSKIFIDDNINYLHKVLLGPFVDEKNAEKVANKLSELGLKTIIILSEG